MRKKLCSVLLSFSLIMPLNVAKADMFGGDVVVLMQILMQAVQQYIKLREMLTTAKDNLETIKSVNSGLDHALGVLDSMYPGANLRVYKDWDSLSAAITKAQKIYGKVPKSANTRSQKDLDTTFIESMVMYNKIEKHSKTIDKIGEQIKRHSRSVSPKGAAKLTAEAMGVSIQVQNQMLKTQAATLKLQAQDMAYRNKLEKEETKMFVESAKNLKGKLQKINPTFKTPRY